MLYWKRTVHFEELGFSKRSRITSDQIFMCTISMSGSMGTPRIFPFGENIRRPYKNKHYYPISYVSRPSTARLINIKVSAFVWRLRKNIACRLFNLSCFVCGFKDNNKIFHWYEMIMLFDTKRKVGYAYYI